MSKFSELIKLVPKGIKNLDKIIEGTVNIAKMEFGTISQEDLEIIVCRRVICATCPFMSKNAEEMGVYKTDRSDPHCIHCGCPISTKTASLESNCGLEDYNANNKGNEITLKWVAVK